MEMILDMCIVVCGWKSENWYKSNFCVCGFFGIIFEMESGKIMKYSMRNKFRK